MLEFVVIPNDPKIITEFLKQKQHTLWWKIMHQIDEHEPARMFLTLNLAKIQLFFVGLLHETHLMCALRISLVHLGRI